MKVTTVLAKMLFIQRGPARRGAKSVLIAKQIGSKLQPLSVTTKGKVFIPQNRFPIAEKMCIALAKEFGCKSIEVF